MSEVLGPPYSNQPCWVTKFIRKATDIYIVKEVIGTSLHLKMVILSKEDLSGIRTLLDLGWTPMRIYEHRVANTLRGARDWKLQTIYDACRKIRAQGGSIKRKQGSGRPRTIRTEENMHRVEALLKSRCAYPARICPREKWLVVPAFRAGPSNASRKISRRGAEKRMNNAESVFAAAFWTWAITW
uniref:Uncharacterized protein n=1 Tax=Acrobeloides nanus TaxID=290746 RepID=A0A914DVQ5_9BILA